MVAVGDEGFYNFGYHEFPQGEHKYVYHGSEGADYRALIQLPNIDFGTVHIYCDQWGLTSEQAKFWFKQHGEDSNAANKPVILEEFGWKDRSTRTSIYADWFKVLEGETYSDISYAGTNYWMLASIMDDGKLYPDYDGYTVYYRGDANGNPTQEAANLIMEHAKRMQAKNGKIVETTKPSVNPTTITVDKTNIEAITLKMELNSNEFLAIKENEQQLILNTDYKVQSDTITMMPS